MSDLKAKVKLSAGIELKNSVIMAPMTTWSSNDDYTVSEAELRYYRARNHGAGMIITGSAHVKENGIGFTNEFAAYDDKFLPGLTKLAQTLKENGAKAILQLNHAGNKALPQLVESEVVSASAVPTVQTAFAPALTPKELTEAEIEEIIAAFGKATKRALEAGFDGVELHGAHGFLLQNFESPFFNKRTDNWGGSRQKRLNFPKAVIAEVKKVIKEAGNEDFILGYRISPDEPMEGALRLEDTYALIDTLIEQGVTYIHASLPDALQARPVATKEEVTYLDALAAYVAQRVPLIAAGAIKTPKQAQSVLATGALPAIGHAFVTDPEWLAKIEHAETIQLDLDPAQINSLQIPDKLWTVIKNSGDWFTIK